MSCSVALRTWPPHRDAIATADFAPFARSALDAMNYRHAFHAGNFADVFKHAILVRILLHLREKDAAFRVIDTHAGAGLYDLLGPEATRTAEWRDGIGRLATAALPNQAAALVDPYIAIVRRFNPMGELRRYPGSPLIAASLLRPKDRLIVSETEPEVAAALAGHLRRSAAAAPDAMAALPEPVEEQPSGTGGRFTTSPGARAKVLRVDGWTALNASVPPKERRGLAIIDPAFEDTADFPRLAEALLRAYRKWPTGIYMAWYPTKTPEGPRRLAAALRRRGIGKLLQLELSLGGAGPGLRSCGILAINPPWKLAAEARIMLPALAECLGGTAGTFELADLRT